MPSVTRLCTPDQLEDKLLELLRAGPATADHLARVTGYSATAVRTRLADLRTCGYVSRSSETTPSVGKHYVWSITEGAEERRAARTPGRDPLLWALFGPAHKEAA